MDYIIRTAENQDIEEIWNIGNNVSGFKTAPNVVTFWPKETLENYINKEDVMFYVVESKNKIIGFTIVNLNKSLGKAEIENIYIYITKIQKKWNRKTITRRNSKKPERKKLQ